MTICELATLDARSPAQRQTQPECQSSPRFPGRAEAHVCQLLAERPLPPRGAHGKEGGRVLEFLSRLDSCSWTGLALSPRQDGERAGRRKFLGASYQAPEGLRADSALRDTSLHPQKTILRPCLQPELSSNKVSGPDVSRTKKEVGSQSSELTCSASEAPIPKSIERSSPRILSVARRVARRVAAQSSQALCCSAAFEVRSSLPPDVDRLSAGL